jgi:hypothetical protein
MNPWGKILIGVVVVFVLYPIAGNLSMLLFMGAWKLTVQQLRPEVGLPGPEVAIPVGLAFPLIVAAIIGGRIARRRRQEDEKEAEAEVFTNDGTTMREQEVGELVSAWSHKDARVRFADGAEADVVRATVEASDGSVECSVLRKTTARDQANVILEAMKGLKVSA